MPNIESSIEFGVNVLQDIITAAYGFLKKEQKKRDLFQRATRKYVKGMLERHGKIKVLGQREPVNLMQLYVRANIIQKITARMGADVQQMQEFFDLQKRSFYKKLETTDAEEIANKLDKFIVLGKPGAGKTTFLKYIALAMLQKQTIIQTRRLPIFVTLRDWADRKTSLLAYITKEFDTCGFPEAEYFVEHALQQGHCLVLFDGLDEVSQEVNLGEIIREIREFSEKYRNNQLVISCRVAAYNHWFDKYSDVEMADFNHEQIATFVKNWFKEESKRGESCLVKLHASDQLKELATIPLLLTLLCITYEEDNSFPKSRVDLYERAIDALLTKWDSSRPIQRRDFYGQLSTRHKKKMFAQIAFETFLDDRYFIRERELLKMIEAFIFNMPGFDQQQLTVEIRDILKSIEAQHGIFVERARKIYSFGHLTFQEYFIAKYLADLDTAEVSERLIESHLHNEKWREVFLLVVGMLPKGDKMLKYMLWQNRKLLKKDEGLNHLLQENPNGPILKTTTYSKTFRKAVELLILFDLSTSIAKGWKSFLSKSSRRDKFGAYEEDGYFAYFLASERENSLNFIEGLIQAFDSPHYLPIHSEAALNLAISRVLIIDPVLTSQLFRAQDLGIKISYFTSWMFIKNISVGDEKVQVLNRVLEQELSKVKDRVRPKDLGQIVDRFHKAGGTRRLPMSTIDRFFYGSTLIISCLNSDCNVSKEVRQEILDTLLAPLTEREKREMGIVE